jgi:hypothetical protein
MVMYVSIHFWVATVGQRGPGLVHTRTYTRGVRVVSLFVSRSVWAQLWRGRDQNRPTISTATHQHSGQQTLQITPQENTQLVSVFR